MIRVELGSELNQGHGCMDLGKKLFEERDGIIVVESVGCLPLHC